MPYDYKAEIAETDRIEARSMRLRRYLLIVIVEEVTRGPYRSLAIRIPGECFPYIAKDPTFIDAMRQITDRWGRDEVELRDGGTMTSLIETVRQ